MAEILASIRRILAGDGDDSPEFKTDDDVVEHLMTREFEPNGRYGIFQKDASVLSFRNDPKGESILSDIRARNAAEGAGNIRISGTNVELINFSKCPQCAELHSYRDLEVYYANPKPMQDVNVAKQLRKDTRVSCKVCEHYFLPALVIADGSPRDETQFLCRTQVIEEIETFLPRPVLTRDRTNILTNEFGKKAILNDVLRHELEDAASLLVNFIQYMPPDDLLAFLREENVEQGHVVYGVWV